MFVRRVGQKDEGCLSKRGDGDVEAEDDAIITIVYFR